MRSPYPATRVPVDRRPATPGSPRGLRLMRPLDGSLAERIAKVEAPDDTRRTGVNTGQGSVWGRRVAPVTGRKARKSPGWTSSVAGGEYISSPLV